MTKTRIATVKATGDRYLVQRMSIDTDPRLSRVYCWGEVMGMKTSAARTEAEALAKGASTTHAASKTFLRDAVDVVEIEVTGAVARELMQQTRRNVPGVVGVSSRRSRR